MDHEHERARSQEYLVRAGAAEESAAAAPHESLRRMFLDLARQWRDLARQADEYDRERERDRRLQGEPPKGLDRSSLG